MAQPWRLEGLTALPEPTPIETMVAPTLAAFAELVVLLKSAPSACPSVIRTIACAPPASLNSDAARSIPRLCGLPPAGEGRLAMAVVRALTLEVSVCVTEAPEPW